MHAGELRCPITIFSVSTEPDGDGFAVHAEKPLYDGNTVMCKWQMMYGSEQFENQTLGLVERAKITVRYDPAITNRHKIRMAAEGADAQPWEIMSMVPVDGRFEWLDIKIRREVKA